MNTIQVRHKAGEYKSSPHTVAVPKNQVFLFLYLFILSALHINCAVILETVHCTILIIYHIIHYYCMDCMDLSSVIPSLTQEGYWNSKLPSLFALKQFDK